MVKLRGCNSVVMADLEAERVVSASTDQGGGRWRLQFRYLAEDGLWFGAAAGGWLTV